MRTRSDGAVGVVAALSVVGLLVTVPAVFVPDVDASNRAIAAVVAALLVALLVRVLMAGLILEPNQMTVRDVLATHRMPRAEVLGLAVERVARGRLQRLVVVCADGRVIPAGWTVARALDGTWVGHAAYLAQGFGVTQTSVAPTLAEHDRFAADGPLPLATRDPGLTPQTVSPAMPGPQSRWLRWETGFVVAAFALPGVAAAITILAQHLGGVGDLDEFDLPLKHHAGVSLFLMSFGYLTTGLVVPIALLLLARTGQPPARLGLTRKGLGHDLSGAVGLLAGAFGLTAALSLLLLPFTDFKATETNTHVPAYFLVYAVLVSATTAINEEVIVNGYFLTRLSQLGWTPWSAFALSFAVRESYHLYYGLAFVMTMPFGYLLTRSFQKRGRVGRAILTHFAYDLILFSIAVLTS
jgi:membrane protease YdiL (CAAX protease family)